VKKDLLLDRGNYPFLALNALSDLKLTKSIPKNVVAAGNPATVVKNLDTEKEIVTRQSLLEEHSELAKRMDAIERWVRAENTVQGWLKSLFWPTKRD